MVPGSCGVVEDGIIPGLFGHEAGQAAVGDLFGWFAGIAGSAMAGPSTICIGQLEADAALLRPGESGLVALDWWNGNRSVLVDAELTGLLLGATLATGPGEIYRALLESTVFGTRVIIEALEASGVAVDDIVACGGLPFQNRLLMQLTADITGRPVRVADVTPGARARLGDVRCGRGRCPRRGLRAHHRGVATDGPPRAGRVPARRSDAGPSRTSSTPSIANSTIRWPGSRP